MVDGPKWIINFPTKIHWRNPSKIQWIEAGLKDLERFIIQNHVRSIALPPLGSGNGGLEWSDVRPIIERVLGALDEVNIIVYEPTAKYQNVAKSKEVEKLTPARALIADLVRQYSALGFECTLLEIQKLAYLLERSLTKLNLDNPLKLEFQADSLALMHQNLCIFLMDWMEAICIAKRELLMLVRWIISGLRTAKGKKLIFI